MSRTTLALLLGLILISGFALGTRPAAAEVQPSTSLLLPYFEVDLDGFGRDSLFSVANAAETPVRVSVGIYTNWGIPVLEVPLSLLPNQIQTVSLRDWLAFGRLPDRMVPWFDLTFLNAALTGRPAPIDGLYYSTAVQPGRAVGYVIVRNESLPPAALWGDYFLTDRGLQYLSGDTLVSLDPAPASPGSCQRHLVRYLEGGGFAAGTELFVWTGQRGQPSATPLYPDLLPAMTCQSYDEQGRQLGSLQDGILATQSMRATEMSFGNAFGWLDVRTAVPSYVGVRFTSRDMATATFQSFCMTAGGTRSPGAAIMVGLLTNGLHADVPPGPMLPVGSAVKWEYFVQNLGNVRLHDVAVSDDPAVRIFCPKSVLDPGESMVCTATGVALGCQFKNIATAEGLAPTGERVTAQDVGYYYGDQAAALTVVTKIEGQVASNPPGPNVALGATVHLTYEVANPGKSPLTGIVVTDDQVAAVHCPGTTLAAGATMVCTGTETAQAGSHVHRVTVQGNPPCGPALTAQSLGHHTVPVPSIALRHLVNGDDGELQPGPAFATGSPLQWSYVVANTGDAALSQIQVSDSYGSMIACPKTFLAAGEAMTCTSVGLAKAGLQDHTAAVTGLPGTGGAVFASDVCHYLGKTLGAQGCTVQYWDNEPDAWTLTPYGPLMYLRQVFPQAALYSNVANASLDEALVFPDGTGAAGAAQTLLRAGVAALLNAAHPTIGSPRTSLEVLAEVGDALESGDRTEMLSLAAVLDAENHLGCPMRVH